MSVKYFCDLCGKEVEKISELTERHADDYENNIAIGYAWKGSVCGECAYKLDYAADEAKMRVVAELRKAVER